MILGIGSSGPQVAEGCTASALPNSCSARASTSPSCAWRLPAKGSSSMARRSSSAPDGPGKALKLTIGPVQERIPIYLAASGRRTPRSRERSPTDGSRPSSLRARVRASTVASGGGDRTGRSLDGFDIAPTVQVFVTDDLEKARDGMRPFIALYVGGMARASRTSTTSWSSDTASRPRPRRSRISTSKESARRRWRRSRRAHRFGIAVRASGCRARASGGIPRRGRGHAGCDPIAFTAPERLEQLRLVAELAA